MKRARHGFTLVETMVTTGLFFVVGAIVLAVLWSVWRGFTYGVAKAQAMQAANAVLERVGNDLANSPIARTGEIVRAGGGWRIPQNGGEAATWAIVRDALKRPLRLEREGKPVRAARIVDLAITAVSAAGPIAVEVEMQDVTGRATVRLRKLVEMPRLRQRARYAGWEQDPAVQS